MTWQPAETAPKDGTKILVKDEGEPNVAWWNPDYIDQFSGAVGAWFDNEWKCTFDVWMPIPA